MGIDETGVVISISGETALVKVEEGEHCSTCASQSGCSRDDETPTQKTVEAINTLNVQVGQKVKLHLKSTDIVKASLLMFVLPLTFLLAGAISGKMFSRHYAEQLSNIITIVSSLGSMGIAFLGIRVYSGIMGKRKVFYPYITKTTK